jgi:uncharacterized protein YdiU (UPF0061 family)
MLQKIATDTAKLIASWQAFGFNHGVMNTDNMSIHGITFDYGPYAFLDDFEPSLICNHSDPQGRHSFDSQPGIGLWDLNALAQAFTPHLETDAIKQALSSYEPTMLEEYSTLIHNKLGLLSEASDRQTNSHIINTWIDMLAVEKRTTQQRLDHFASSIYMATIKICVISLFIEKDLMNGLNTIHWLYQSKAWTKHNDKHRCASTTHILCCAII